MTVQTLSDALVERDRADADSVGSMVGAVGIKVSTRNTLWDHTHQVYPISWQFGLILADNHAGGLIFFLIWVRPSLEPSPGHTTLDR